MNRNFLSSPVFLQRLEGAVLLAAALVVYYRVDGNWLLFVALLLAPDVSAIGYAFGPAFGATTYNLVHTYLLPAGLAAYGVFAGHVLLVQLAAIWFAHIGMDRIAGYGLKFRDRFGHTHLAQFGKKAAVVTANET
jgi:hypothetical protein